MQERHPLSIASKKRRASLSSSLKPAKRTLVLPPHTETVQALTQTRQVTMMMTSCWRKLKTTLVIISWCRLRLPCQQNSLLSPRTQTTWTILQQSTTLLIESQCINHCSRPRFRSPHSKWKRPSKPRNNYNT